MGLSLVCTKASPAGGILFNPTWGEQSAGWLLFLSQKKKHGFSPWTPTAVRTDLVLAALQKGSPAGFTVVKPSIW